MKRASYMMGNGEIYEDSVAPNLMFLYKELGTEVTPENFNEIKQISDITYKTKALSDVIFKMKDDKIINQPTSEYYFAHLEFEIPRNTN